MNHDELQKQYALDAILHPKGKPWEYWQMNIAKPIKDGWVNIFEVDTPILWDGKIEYRRKSTAPNWDEELSPKEVAECNEFPEGYYFDGGCIRFKDNYSNDWYVLERGRFNEDTDKGIDEIKGTKQTLLNHFKKRREAALAAPTKLADCDPKPNVMSVSKVFPEDDAERAKYPIGTFITEYFPNALAALAKHSWESNEKHNPGEPVHWAKDKSIGNIDRVFRHLIDNEKVHAAWRLLELIEREITKQ